MQPGEAVLGLRNVVLIGLVFWAASLCAHPDKAEYQRPDVIPAPADNPLSQASIDLGKRLFFDPRLSGSNNLSCASCHIPEKGWSDGLPKAMNESKQVLKRATPTLINTAYQRHYTWDGQFRDLETQALMPITSPLEMNQSLDKLTPELREIAVYQALFAKVYPDEGISVSTVTKALASFERSLVANEAPFDRWVNGDDKAISASVKRGFTLFEGKANCVACHHGFNFTDGGFHNIGLKDSSDLGRFGQVAIDTLKGAFKTPTLRDVVHTAPYMHDGRYASLEAVIEHYDRGGEVTEHLDPSIRPLFLTNSEKQDLLALLKSLSAEPALFERPELP